MPLIRKPTKTSAANAPDATGVLKSLTSPDVDERWKAARAAADISGAAVVLGKAIPNESDARVREAMFTSVARSRAPESVDVLLGLLRSDNANFRTGALDAMRAMGPAVLDKLPAILHDADSDIRILSCELLRHLPGDAATELLCDLLDGEQDVNVCAAAVDVLAEVGGTAAIPALERCEARFAPSPFLSFAIKTAAQRITAAKSRV